MGLGMEANSTERDRICRAGGEPGHLPSRSSTARPTRRHRCTSQSPCSSRIAVLLDRGDRGLLRRSARRPDAAALPRPRDAARRGRPRRHQLRRRDAGARRGLGRARADPARGRRAARTYPRSAGSLRPSVLLATLGVLITAAIASVAAHWALDVHWRTALLIGAVVSSTDAAAVFAAVRNVGLRHRVESVLELESGDQRPVRGDPRDRARRVADARRLRARGRRAAARAARSASALARRDRSSASRGLAAATAAAPLGRDRARGRRRRGARGVRERARSSAARGCSPRTSSGLTVGDARIPHAGVVRGFLQGGAWLAQIGLFVLLGLLVTPVPAAGRGLAPLVVAVDAGARRDGRSPCCACTTPFRLPGARAGVSRVGRPARRRADRVRDDPDRRGPRERRARLRRRLLRRDRLGRRAGADAAHGRPPARRRRDAAGAAARRPRHRDAADPRRRADRAPAGRPRDRGRHRDPLAVPARRGDHRRDPARRRARGASRRQRAAARRLPLPARRARRGSGSSRPGSRSQRG